MKDTIRSSCNRLHVSTAGALATSWAALLRRGVGVTVDVPVSLREFMIRILGMDEQYATESVPGLFLNNAPVDDWRTEMVGGGDEVGMSGTMPGLCGIALRRSSPIRAFRPDLVDRRAVGKHGGVIKLKMFNFVAVDCCEAVFARGVVVSPAQLRQFLEDQELTLAEDRCRWNDVAKDCATILREVARADEDILLTVQGGVRI